MSRSVFSIAVIITALALAGCQSETVESGSGPVMSPAPIVETASSPSPAPPPASRPSPRGSEFRALNAATDPCAARLQDICGALLLAYVQNQKLPATLEELQPYSGGIALTFTCPTSDTHYVYVPDGLKAQNVRDILIVYDQEAVHSGQRWGIVMVPAQPGSAMTMYVIPLNDRLFKAYQSK